MSSVWDWLFKVSHCYPDTYLSIHRDCHQNITSHHYYEYSFKLWL